MYSSIRQACNGPIGRPEIQPIFAVDRRIPLGQRLARALTEQESPQWKRIAQARHAAIAANLQKGKNALQMQNDLRPMKTFTSPSSHTPPLGQAAEIVDAEDYFLLQLAKTIQTWLWVEDELYSLYSMLMQGANSHLVSATFNSIQSVDAKLTLLNSCFTLVFQRGSDDLKAWRTIVAKVEKLNKQRNKIVHEPVSLHYSKGVLKEVKLGPSYSNSLALAKGQTTHQGEPVVSAGYNPSKVHVLENHRLTLAGIAALENTFKETAREMRAYREQITPKIASAFEFHRKNPLEP